MIDIVLVVLHFYDEAYDMFCQFFSYYVFIYTEKTHIEHEKNV